MIEISNLTKNYSIDKQLFKAVDSVNLSVKKGEFISIVGHSGSGKTTLLSLVGGLTRPDSGRVIIDGTDIWTISDDRLSEFRNKKINFIFQFSSLIPTLTVIENIMLPTVFGEYAGDVREYALKLLDMVGLRDKANLYPSQLSGGQQRRVAIARAFVNRPEIILADEPTGDLDEETELEMMRLFRMMNKERGITYVMVTHNIELAGQTGRQLKMNNGIIEDLITTGHKL